MRRTVVAPLCPVVLAAFPATSLFAQNQTEVELGLLWLPLGVSILVAALLYALSLLVTRSESKAAVVASLIVVAVFYYGFFADSAPRFFVGAWLALFLLGLAATLRAKRPLEPLVLVIGIAALVTALPSAASVVLFAVRHPDLSAADPRLWPAALPAPAASAGAARPDIYVLIPDDYARADVLKQYLGYDDAPFLAQLQRRGFTVSPQVRSPYSDSESNTAALLNLDYLTSFPRVLGPSSQDVRPVKRVIEDNRAARLLTSLGYDYVHIDTDEVTFAGGNPHISRFAPPDSFANLWLQKSILRLVGGPLGFDQSARNARFRHSISSQFAALRSVRHDGRPKFVVFHTLLPHDPYVYDERGRPVTFRVRSDQDLASGRGRAAYRSQLEYLNRQLLAAIDRIESTSATPPVIVLQSDEGFQADPGTFGEAAMRDIRVKGLSAFSLPRAPGARLPDPPNSVNDLRFVFNTYLGTRYAMLPTASYAEGDRPYDGQELRVK